MTIQILSRCGAAAALMVLASACSFPGGGGECRWNRSSCMYEGSYEPGEREYAEEEARRLNREAPVRVGR